jgi:hypothetical protein
LFRIFVPNPSASERLPLRDIVEWSVDQAQCDITGVSLAANLIGTEALQSDRFSMNSFTLEIKTTSSYFDFIYLKAGTLL